MNIFIIGNPISSGGDARRRILQLASRLSLRGHRVESYLTRFAGDGKKKIAGIKEEFDRIVIVGGDGTLNEIINGLPSPYRTPLLHFPTGNANLLAKDLKLPKNIDEAVQLLENGKIIAADLPVMLQTKFIMVAGAGFDARVTEAVKMARTGKINNLSYFIPILKALQSADNRPLRVAVDNRKPVEGASVLVCNVRNYAGICQMAYEAGVQTNRLDIVILPKDSLISFGLYLFFAKFSKITKLPGVSYLKGKQVVITANKLIPMEIDGDFIGRYPEVTIRLNSEKLPLVTPH